MRVALVPRAGLHRSRSRAATSWPRSRSASYHGVPVLDLDYAEDSGCDTDMNVVMTDGGGFIEVQGTAEGHAVHAARKWTRCSRWRERGIARHCVAAQTARPWAVGDEAARAGSRATRASCASSARCWRRSASRSCAQAELGIADAEEPHATFVENALLKARHAARVTGLPALADDSGLCVDALGGAPGRVLGALRRASRDRTRATTHKLRRRRWRASPTSARALLLRAGAACAMPTTREPLIAEGRWHGRIVDAPRGDGGFGYDPLF